MRIRAWGTFSIGVLHWQWWKVLLDVQVFCLWLKWVTYSSIQMRTGANEFGQLGDGTEESAQEPKKVKSLETELVKSVSCGAHCTAAVAEPRENDGTLSKSRLWVWGQNQVCAITSHWVNKPWEAHTIIRLNIHHLHACYRVLIILAFFGELSHQTQ